MRIVFFGTPHFAAEVLLYLVDHLVDVVAVVTRKDSPKGRSAELLPTPVKELALTKNIPVYQPEKVSDPSFSATLKSFQADLFVVVAYGEILKQEVLDTPHMGCINLHTSLLPKYRGAAPIQRAIMAGEKETGVSIMHMVRKMDAGDVIVQKALSIPPDAIFAEVEEALCTLGKELLLEVIDRYQIGVPPSTIQDESKTSLAPKIELVDCEINWNRSAEEIHNLVRSVNPYPGAFCNLLLRGEKRMLKIMRTKIVAGPSQSKTELTVPCKTGFISLLEVKLEGKKMMHIEEFLRGYPAKELTFL